MILYCPNCGHPLSVNLVTNYPRRQGACSCGVIMEVTPAALNELRRIGPGRVVIGVDDVEEHHLMIPAKQPMSAFTKALLFGVPAMIILIVWQILQR
jgi:hypothetical protein